MNPISKCALCERRDARMTGVVYFLLQSYAYEGFFVKLYKKPLQCFSMSFALTFFICFCL